MFFRRIIAVCTVLALPLLIGAGCTFTLSAPKTGALIKTEDFGDTWSSKSTLALGNGKFANLATVEVTKIVMDPRGTDTMFLGTKQHGLFASNNRGESWQQLIPKQYVLDIGLDPVARCTIYMITPLQLFKTINCAESWDVVLNESRGGTVLSTIAIDPSNASLLYVGTSAGDIFSSIDGGANWAVLTRFKTGFIKRIILDERSPTLMLVGMKDGVLWESATRGGAWKDISPLQNERDSSRYRIFDTLSSSSNLLYASERAMYTTTDRGAHWKTIPFLTPVGSTSILAAGSGLADGEFYYVTLSTLFSTQDGGKQWLTKPIAANRYPSVLMVDTERHGAVYVGLKNPPEDSRYWYRQEQDL